MFSILETQHRYKLMILNTTPAHTATLSNTGEVSDFKIKASPKAFQMLSAGYSNRIRAIVRELSCNAIDSHVSANTIHIPYEVHLPSTLEPWFSIKDYGVGLDRNEIPVYITYFESPKTESNDFIGALGLGAKSPYSYTNNFSVTTIKNGWMGIYSAFINDMGFPSIVLMHECTTTEPNGVEIKFSVEDKDFWAFACEAAEVYKHLKYKPTILGNNNFRFTELNFHKKDIIDGIHKVVGWKSSKAVMGGIPYPINIPNLYNTLGELSNYLTCGLLIEFDIGELAFLPSREELSYIPMTINTIRDKLTHLHKHLISTLNTELSKIKNKWEQGFHILSLDPALWEISLNHWIKQNDFKLVTTGTGYYKWYENKLTMTVDELANSYNIKFRMFKCAPSSIRNSFSTLKPTGYNQDTWIIPVDKKTHFVIADIKTGTISRAKNSYKNKECTIIILEPVDSNKLMDTDGFFEKIYNPPTWMISRGSELKVETTVKQSATNISILKYDTYRLTWQNCGTLDTFCSEKTHYYIPLSGYSIVTEYPFIRIDRLVSALRDSKLFDDVLPVYGVRKSKIKTIQTLSNWIPIDEYIKDRLPNLVDTIANEYKISLFKTKYIINWDLLNMVSNTSPIIEMGVKYNNKNRWLSVSQLREQIRLVNMFLKFDTIRPDEIETEVTNDINKLYRLYPLIKHCKELAVNEIADYINAMDLFRNSQKSTPSTII